MRNELNPTEPDKHTPPPVEDGKDHPTIAITKAKYWSKIHDGLAVSSDGGLQIPALKDRWDSTQTNRAAGDNTSSQEKTEHLLSLMNGLVADDRRASWIESVAIANRGELVNVWTASGSEGYILHNSNGRAPEGLWTSSLHYFPKLKKTRNEISQQELTLVQDPWTSIKSQIELFSTNQTGFIDCPNRGT